MVGIEKEIRLRRESWASRRMNFTQTLHVLARQPNRSENRWVDKFSVLLCGAFFSLFVALFPGIMELAASTVSATTNLDDRPAYIEVLVRKGCPHCEVVKVFLGEMRRDRPSLNIVVREIREDPEASARPTELANQLKVQQVGVPAFYLHDELIIGYDSADRTGARIGPCWIVRFNLLLRLKSRLHPWRRSEWHIMGSSPNSSTRLNRWPLFKCSALTRQGH